MLIDSVTSITKRMFGVAGVIVLAIAILCFIPMVALWTLNTLVELGGGNFYIEHTLFSYFVAFVAVALMNSGSSKSSDK